MKLHTLCIMAFILMTIRGGFLAIEDNESDLKPTTILRSDSVSSQSEFADIVVSYIDRERLGWTNGFDMVWKFDSARRLAKRTGEIGVGMTGVDVKRILGSPDIERAHSLKNGKSIGYLYRYEIRKRNKRLSNMDDESITAWFDVDWYVKKMTFAKGTNIVSVEIKEVDK